MEPNQYDLVVIGSGPAGQKSAICAEGLVPERVPPEFIIGAYVSCPTSESDLRERAPSLTVEIRAGLFFQDE